MLLPLRRVKLDFTDHIFTPRSAHWPWYGPIPICRLERRSTATRDGVASKNSSRRPSKKPAPLTTERPPAAQTPSSSSSATVSRDTPTQSSTFIPPTTASEDATCNSNLTPSDMAIAASPRFVVQVTNSCFRAINLSGSLLGTTALGAFFSSVATSTDFIVDPRALYDPVADRFIVIAEDATPSPNLLLVAASQSGDPTLAWNQYGYAMGSTSQAADFPTLGQTLIEAGDVGEPSMSGLICSLAVDFREAKSMRCPRLRSIPRRLRQTLISPHFLTLTLAAPPSIRCNP